MSDPPPSYAHATTSTSSSHKARNGIPPHSRRSMEDELRELPPGWVRQYDSESNHQFFVDTTANPPRSIWHHPYDDRPYLDSLSTDERLRIQELHQVPSHADIVAESSDEDEDGTHHSGQQQYRHPEAQLPPRGSPPPTGVKRFGRNLKNKLTSTTHDERQEARRQREEEERAAYERHQKYRAAMNRAEETGQPQLIGKDRNGQDVYVEPSYNDGGWGGNYPGNAYRYNPYTRGPYSVPNARYLRPAAPYGRPYYGGYGGGLGRPGLGFPLLGLGLGAGLLGGGLLF